MNVPDDLTLLALDAGAGDRRSLTAFLRNVQPDVWRYCSAMVGAEDADDAAQESLTRIFTSIARFQATAPARVWALSITRHTCLDWLRKSYRRRSLADRLRQRPSSAAPHDHSWAELQQLVERLDVDRREAFVLTQVLGWSYAEAAETCGCPVGTIRSRVARARLDLVDQYGLGQGLAERREPS